MEIYGEDAIVRLAVDDIMNAESFIQIASDWMIARGWRQKVAKRRYYDQSLFEHSLVELDVALHLMPILRLPNHFDLSLEEEQIIYISLIAHDIGKERDEWQDYILGKRGFVSDVEPVLTKSILPGLCSSLGFPSLDRKATAVIENCINLHMSHERRDTNILTGMLQGTDRWYTLANLVYHIDNICSAKGIIEAKSALERSLLIKHLKTAYHQVVIRGVSTIALHRAALDSFTAAGWIPLLHFCDATLYVCSGAKSMPEPSFDQIKDRLTNILKDATGRDVTQFLIGSPTNNILPKPDLFEYNEIKQYLEAAARKVGRRSFLAKYESEKKRATSRNTRIAGKTKSKTEVIEDYCSAKGKAIDRYSKEMDREAERISNAHPDMVVLKFFKAAMKLIDDPTGRRIVEEEFQRIFGSGSWEDLLSTSTLMAAQDMRMTVDRFWQLSGSQFGLKVKTLEEIDNERRTELLIGILTEISKKVFSSIPNPPTRNALAQKMSVCFIQDLANPTAQVDPAELARQQMEFYSVSKIFAGKQTKKASYICPMCNAHFKKGIKAKADFIANPKSHTNRGISHGQFGYITICETCYYERILRQLLMGEKVEEIIVIFPRMNIGPSAGELLVRKSKALYDKSYSIMVGDSDDPDRHLRLAFTPFIADQVLDKDLFRLNAEELANLLTYRSGEENRKKSRRQLEKALREEYEDDLDAANTAWSTNFTSWDESVSAVYANNIEDPIVRQIRTEIYRLYPQMRLVCQTPHAIMLPMSYSIRLNDDSEANAALRRTFLALLLGISLGVSVAIVRDSDQIGLQGGEGIAFVPPVAAVRELIGANWIPLNEAKRWLQWIGIASILASAGRYSERSGLLEVLIAPTAGHVLRRIEQKRALESQRLTYHDISNLRILEEVMQFQK